MARLVTFLFDTRASGGNDGKITVTMNNTDAPGAPYDFYIGITAPGGEEIKALPTVTPDATLDGGETDFFLVDIPLDSNGDYLEGTYTFVTRRDDGAADDTSVTDTYTYVSHNAPDHLTGTPILTVAFNCLTGLIQATDATDYATEGLTLDDREITITPPSVDSQEPEVSANSSATMTVAYTNVTYSVALALSLTWGESDLGSGVDALSNGTVILYQEVEVECETGGICESLECLGTELTRAYNDACASGGYSRLAQASKDKIEWAMMNLSMAQFQYNCGNITASQTYLSRAKEGINCGCGCSGTDSDSTPRPFTPPAAIPDLADFTGLLPLPSIDPGDATDGQVLTWDSTAEEWTPETPVDYSLDYWAESQSGGGSVWTPVNAATDYDAIIAPKGSGAIRARTGGTARGANAIDLQTTATDGTYIASGAQSIAIGTNNKAFNQYGIAIGRGNTSNTDGAKSVAIGTNNSANESDSVAIGQTNVTQEPNSVAIGSVNTINAANGNAIGSSITIDEAGSSAIGYGLQSNGVNQFLRGNLASAHQINQDVFGVGSFSLQRSVYSLSRQAVTGASAFLVTASGGASNDLSFPAGNWCYACKLTFLAVITATDGGFAVGDSFMAQRQFVVTKNGSTTTLQGSVEDIGTDVSTASLSTLAIAITADDAVDMIKIEVTPPAAMGAGDAITVFATLETLEVAL